MISRSSEREAQRIWHGDISLSSVQALTAQQPYTIGADAVQQAAAWLSGKPTIAKIGTKFTIITKNNLSSAASQAAIYKTSC